MNQETIVLSIVLTGIEHYPAFELAQETEDCGLLSLAPFAPLDEQALTNFVKQLYRRAQEAGVWGTVGSPKLLAGSISRHKEV